MRISVSAAFLLTAETINQRIELWLSDNLPVVFTVKRNIVRYLFYAFIA